MLDTRTEIIVHERVDLALVKVGAQRLVIGEFYTRVRVPEHRGSQARARLSIHSRVVLRVKLNAPVFFQAEHVLAPQHQGSQRQKIAGDVINVSDAEAVDAAFGRIKCGHLRGSVAKATLLNKRKSRVSEGGRDAERAPVAAIAFIRLDLVHDRSTT